MEQRALGESLFFLYRRAKKDPIVFPHVKKCVCLGLGLNFNAHTQITDGFCGNICLLGLGRLIPVSYTHLTLPTTPYV